MKLRTVLLLMLLPVTGSAQLQFQTGNQLKETCDAQDPASSMYCMGYISGVNDSNSFKICMPARGTQGQMKEIVKKFLSENPQSLHSDADTLVFRALQQAFPCPKR